MRSPCFPPCNGRAILTWGNLSVIVPSGPEVRCPIDDALLSLILRADTSENVEYGGQRAADDLLLAI